MPLIEIVFYHATGNVRDEFYINQGLFSSLILQLDLFQLKRQYRKWNSKTRAMIC